MRETEDDTRVRASGKRSLDDLSSSPPHTTSERVRTDESSSTSCSPSGQIHDADLGDSETVASALSHPDLYSASSSELSLVSSMDSSSSMPSSNDTPAKYQHDDSLFRSSPPTSDSPSGLSSSAPPSWPALPIPPRTFYPRGTISRALVTVLGSALIGSHGKATTIVDSIEFWPTPPRPKDVFSFT